MSAFLRVLAVVLNTLALIINYITNLIVPARKKTYPAIKNPLLLKSVTDLGIELQSRMLKSEELVQAYIERIREVNATLNAVVDERFDDAIKEACHADRLIATATKEIQLFMLFSRYPLLGIPFTVKESCGVKGLSFSVGCLERKNHKCSANGDVVDLLRKAGGIPLLVSSNPEFCLAFDTDTLLNGRCLNPYDLRRSSAGSSGGEGALHGAGASLFGVASDISGSIRLPALFCGVFGHKPTGGLVSVCGHFPFSHTDVEFPNFLQIGPMTRFARDLPLLLQVMAGENNHKLNFEKPMKLQDIKIYYTYSMGSMLHAPTDFEIKLAIKRAVKCFEKGGLKTEKIQVPGFQNAIELSLSALTSIKGNPSVITQSTEDKPSRKTLLLEIIQSLLGRSSHTAMPLFVELMINMNAFISDEEVERCRIELKNLKSDLIELLGTNGVLFLPTYHKTANFFNGCSVLNLGGIILMLLFNILGFPATHVPMGLDRNGLPVGFQVVAAPYMDKLCLQIAAELEGAFGGWVQP